MLIDVEPRTQSISPRPVLIGAEFIASSFCWFVAVAIECLSLPITWLANFATSMRHGSDLVRSRRGSGAERFDSENSAAPYSVRSRVNAARRTESWVLDIRHRRYLITSCAVRSSLDEVLSLMRKVSSWITSQQRDSMMCFQSVRR
jgi:hypothetical protein